MLTDLLVWAQLKLPIVDTVNEKALQFAFFQGALTGGLLVLTIVFALSRKAQ
jgi:hypothetical protein